MDRRIESDEAKVTMDIHSYTETIHTTLAFVQTVAVVQTVVFIAGIGYVAYLWFRGILPVLLRLGNGLAKRKIAIFAKGDHLNSLKSLLCDSGLFRQKILLKLLKMATSGKRKRHRSILFTGMTGQKRLTRF